MTTRTGQSGRNSVTRPARLINTRRRRVITAGVLCHDLGGLSGRDRSELDPRVKAWIGDVWDLDELVLVERVAGHDEERLIDGHAEELRLLVGREFVADGFRHPSDLPAGGFELTYDVAAPGFLIEAPADGLGDLAWLPESMRAIHVAVPFRFNRPSTLGLMWLLAPDAIRTRSRSRSSSC
ncbi:MAG: hypothetical protein GEU86_12695 [Actinophytocola sp.]|nr:hypothetical protein [Actinophytocola sp.]